MDNLYNKQELISRLQFLAKQLEDGGRSAKIIHDTIAYLTKEYG